ncbi:AraC family transcriptional regulator [Hyphomonas oceanitis]|uniref:AraC family transcriptional regulator n=1 Tax=Hyphomonas oceanitis TaxID=81033 RepID=UPI003001DB3A
MDPLASIISLLRPRALSPKLISGSGRWAVRYTQVSSAGFGLVLEGACTLRIDGGDPVMLAKGDFVLMPPNEGFTMYSDPDAEPVVLEPEPGAGRLELRHGEPEGTPGFRQLGGSFRLDAANVDLLAGMLPRIVHIRASEITASRLADLIGLIADEATSDRPGRDLIVERLVEVMLVEALRFQPERAEAMARPGLLEGLGDPGLASVLRRIHADVARPWTVAELAREAGLSRSIFSERFLNKVGVPPIEYVIGWRMALAKDYLQRGDMPLEQVASAVGYQSASALSTAFRRRVGQSPRAFTHGAR